ncbi:zinc finger, c2h2 domain-containing protein [Gigaspora margarita]|uniref:Zinc finger, c2h2 domain-containing protein n=1 Tax=Gigaspora margarita TaxID=4874 RepID=A0A8H4ESK9_GIGMA|nr:zinc finger, c2h2 domain-containing protein [Gigaspora margarita]
MLQVHKHKIDLDNLDFNRSYTLEEFEFINEQLKIRTLIVDGEPRKSCFEISGQLRNWILSSRDGGGGTCSQGSFNFYVRGNRTIRAPDIAYTPKDIDHKLNPQQNWTFKGDPFTPIFIIEVGDIGNDIKNSKFVYLDEKIKNEYFAEGTSVQLCWLIDPQNKRIYTYKRGQCRQEHGWRDVNGENILPNFTLDIEMVNDVLSQTPSETSENENDLEINCPECDETFTERLFFMKHYEKQHARKRQHRN